MLILQNTFVITHPLQQLRFKPGNNFLARRVNFFVPISCLFCLQSRCLSLFPRPPIADGSLGICLMVWWEGSPESWRVPDIWNWSTGPCWCFLWACWQAERQTSLSFTHTLTFSQRYWPTCSLECSNDTQSFSTEESKRGGREHIGNKEENGMGRKEKWERHSRL